ncbi:pentapeptide repeat-containing protein [Calothrix sp. UHCC 0171]|uniref:pentapeptide repeat-containing protein n=1 Tax=Calothrix sp. UHCC 0171 TaxID=3110245 RepID=UPI002B2002FB|nr:pentapeptide repeat-containing protein [Calothrix sp. UHCC 0171]MEA5571012.1 pentapeptide repeat-containing protein [Calothrix sp. UHCC 0171]
MHLSIRHWLAVKFTKDYCREILRGDTVGGISLRIINEIDIKGLSIFDISTLGEILELPVSAAWEEIPGIIQLTQSLLFSLSQKKPLKRNEGVWLGFQIAYLNALQQILEQEVRLQKPWLNRGFFWHREIDATPFLSQDSQLQGLLKTLNPGKLSDTQAEQALTLVTESLLVQQMNHATVAWFMANGAEESEAKLMVQRLANSLPGHLLTVIAENAAALAQLQKFVRLGNSFFTDVGVPGDNKSLSLYASDKIDLYREQYRASFIKSLAEPLFLEYFSLKDIYISPKGLPIAASHLHNSGSTNPYTEAKTSEAVDLIPWVQDEIEDFESITVVESEPGYGKTSFCQILAAKIAQELYPNWMPVLIRLRDIKHGENLLETLTSALPEYVSTQLGEWLGLKHVKCLLILDGLDELPMGNGRISTTKFIQQLLHFQLRSRHVASGVSQHKIIITSRSQFLQEILDSNTHIIDTEQLRRIVIQPFRQEELRLWFQNWATLQSIPLAQNFFTFLKQAGLFANNSKLPEFSLLVRQPLYLYLLGILYRDGLFDNELIELAAQQQQTGGAVLLWEIYQRLNRWLLGYPGVDGIKPMLIREGTAHIHRTQDAIAHLFQTHNRQDLRLKIQAIALKILQSQRHYSQIADAEIAGEYKDLPGFYFRPCPISGKSSPSTSLLPDYQETKIEFSHTKIGDFLCAEAIVSQLKQLTQRQRNAYGENEFVLDTSDRIAEVIYNLLGYGILTPEIEELVIAGLYHLPATEFSFATLCDRLLLVWYPHCQGRWLDEGMAHQAWQYLRSLHNHLNVEQVNAAVALNLFFLLCACHREAKRSFFPCHNPSNWEEFHPEILTQLINRVSVLAPQAFQRRIRAKSLNHVNLSGANLTQVNLSGANLEAINLGNANLAGANLANSNLAGANLANANLTGANLTGANLKETNFYGANLTAANLTDAKLQPAIFTNACLHNAILSPSDKERVCLNGGMFALEEYQALKHLLSQQSRLELSNVHNSTANTDIWFSNMPEMGLIESIEGEMLPQDLYEDEVDDETFVEMRS